MLLVLLLLPLLGASTAVASAAPSGGHALAADADEWTVLRHTDCSQAGNVLWRTSFADCLAKSDGKSFMYTNEKWTGMLGCIVSQGTCTYNCTVGDCGNWDSYYCASGKCAPPKAPPAPAPPPPPAVGLVHRALGSHMVLQRDVPARIWGGSAVGEITVTVSGGGGAETQTTTAHANGSWSVDLKPRNATATPSSIAVACPACPAAANKHAVLTDVLFGDVFVCGGQVGCSHTAFHNCRLVNLSDSNGLGATCWCCCKCYGSCLCRATWRLGSGRTSTPASSAPQPQTSHTSDTPPSPATSPGKKTVIPPPSFENEDYTKTGSGRTQGELI
jgi:hypothetical protein